jgi:hypothetical protein
VNGPERFRLGPDANCFAARRNKFDFQLDYNSTIINGKTAMGKWLKTEQP